MGPLVGRGRQRPRLLRLQARGRRQAAQGAVRRRVPDRRPQRARERVPRADVGGAAVLPPALAVGAPRREHQREQRRPVRRPGGAAARATSAASTASGCRGSPGVLETRRLRQADDRQRPAGDHDRSERAILRDRYQCRVETLPAVDRGIASLVETLRREGELDDTIIVFSSDNGTFQGQHRLPGGKGLAYDEAAHLPLVVRAPAKYTGGAQAAARGRRAGLEHRLRRRPSSTGPEPRPARRPAIAG